MLGPAMISHMMLSLKKVAVKTTEQVSLPTIANSTSRGLSVGRNQSLHFALPAFDMSHGAPEIPVTSSEEDLELDSIPRYRKINPGIMKGSYSCHEDRNGS